jgi:lipopolysaccharide export LptBFGC system permease protein LptF
MRVAVVAMVLVAAAIPLWNRPRSSGYRFAALYLVPQALPIALPVGLAVGILAGTTRGKSSPWIRVRLLAVALVCSGVSFAITGWVVPKANQEFRLAIFERLTGQRSDLLRGTAELTFDELFRGARTEALLTHDSRRVGAAFYVRIALPLAPVALAIVALVATGRSDRRWLHALAGAASVPGFYALLVGFESLIKAGAIGPIAAGFAVPFLFVSASLLILPRTSPVT